MCLILFSYKCHPKYQLVLAANRDEFYERPTAPLAYWQDHPQILAGRDLQVGGTWMGITQSGRWAAITNYREPGMHQSEVRSRGLLVADFLTDTTVPLHYLKRIQAHADQYKGFNLLLGNPAKLHYYSNRGKQPARLRPGVYGLSNHLLDTSWPKVRRAKDQLSALNPYDGDCLTNKLSELLQDQTSVADPALPDSGVGLEWERLLAPIFITSPAYGTRCSSILLIDYDGKVQFSELTWQAAQSTPQLKKRLQFGFTIDPHVG